MVETGQISARGCVWAPFPETFARVVMLGHPDSWVQGCGPA